MEPKRPAFLLAAAGLGSGKTGTDQRNASSQTIGTSSPQPWNPWAMTGARAVGRRHPQNAPGDGGPKTGRNMSLEDCASSPGDLRSAGCRGSDLGRLFAGGFLAGIDRPLTRPKDFQRFAGHEAKGRDHRADRQPETIQGGLLGLAGGRAALDVEGAELELPLNIIHKAKLVLTDALIAAHQQGRTNEFKSTRQLSQRNPWVKIED